jgi:5'-3' exonuclease
LKKRILVIDSAGIYHYYKYKFIKGEIDNLVESFLLEIQKLVYKLNPNIVVLLNDETKSRYRNELAKDYKSKRVERLKKLTNKELEAEKLVLDIKKNLKLFKGLFIYAGVKDCEADDVGGMLYLDERLKGYDIIGVSSDKDWVTVFEPDKLYKWAKERFTNSEDTLGFTRNEFLFYQGISGDSVDGFSGLKGAGTGTAEKLVRKYKTINNLLQNAYNDSFEENDRYVRKALQRLCMKEGIAELKLGYHLAKIFRNTEYLNETELKRYEEIVQDILNYKKPEPSEYVSKDLDNYLLESRAYDAEKIISEIGAFL